jgi:hypothetical protein
MGLDIAFDREKALAAGMQTRMATNGSPEAIAQAQDNWDEDPDYNRWLEEVVEIIRVPGMMYWVTNDGLDGDVVVRANHWGPTYKPLTDWLKENQIEWSEF